MRIGFIGLGRMGKPMAINLVKVGHDVTVVNRSQEKVRELVALGAKAGTTPAALAAESDVTMACLFETETIEQVIEGPGGVLEGAGPGSMLIDFSTQRPAMARRIAARCQEAGVAYVEAPISGTGQRVWDADLTVMVGSGDDEFERALPLLRVLGKNVQHMGGVGTGNATKLVNNMVKDVTAAASMEALVLGAKLGMDPRALYEAMRTASAANRQLDRIAPKILERIFNEGSSSVGTTIKDQALVQELIDEAGMTLPLRDAALALFKRAADAGYADDDTAAAIWPLEADAGVEVRGPGAGRSDTTR
jgi:2-hydroxy-3-oxopropionate reductase